MTDNTDATDTGYWSGVTRARPRGRHKNLRPRNPWLVPTLRASLNEDDLGRLNAYLLPLLGTDNRGGLSAREREVIDHHQVAGLTEPEYALADLAVAVNNDPQSIRDADYDHLRQLGLDDHLILEALSIAAFIGATNRIGIALAVPPNPEYTGVPQH